MSTNELVKALLENDEEIDPKEWITRQGGELHEDKWEQIDGDVNAWTYGGTWHNAHRGMIMHIEGLDESGMNDITSDDIELSQEEIDAFMQQFPVDPDEDGGDQNDDERERAMDELKERRADEANAARKTRVYRFTDEPFRPDEWVDAVEHIQRDFPEFDNLPDAAKWVEIGRLMGFGELDPHPDLMTKHQIEEILKFGIN